MSNPMKKFVKLLGKSERVYCQCVGESVYITDGYIAIKVPKFWYNELILTESPIFQPLDDGETATKDCNAKICKTVPNGLNIEKVMCESLKKERLWKSPFLMESPLDSSLGGKIAQMRLFISENEIIPVRNESVEACEYFVTGDYYSTGNKLRPIIWVSDNNEFISLICPVRIDQSKLDKLKATLCK